MLKNKSIYKVIALLDNLLMHEILYKGNRLMQNWL